MNPSQKRKQLDFKGADLYVGIDLHKKSWVVAIRMSYMELTTFSMDPSPAKLHKYLVKNYPGATYHSCYEAGGFGFWIHRELVKLGIKNIVINAAVIPTTDKEKKNKQDRIDSRKLCRELANWSLTAVYVPDEFHEQLRSFRRLHRRFTSNQTRVKNRIKAHLLFNGITIPGNYDNRSCWSGAFIKWLSDLEFSHQPGKKTLEFYLDELKLYRLRLAEIIKMLREYSHEHELSDTIEYLKSVPGIGFLTAIVLYTEIIDIHRFKKIDHFLSYLGFVPGSDSSGDRDKDTGLTNRCNHYLRYLILEAAWVATRKDPALTLKFQEFCKRMSKQDAIIRITKKLASRIRFVWKNQKQYVPAVIELGFKFQVQLIYFPQSIGKEF